MEYNLTRKIEIHESFKWTTKNQNRPGNGYVLGNEHSQRVNAGLN